MDYSKITLISSFTIEDLTCTRWNPYKEKRVFIEWFHNKKRLGSGYVVEGSGKKDRQQEALKRGIKSYNRFVLDRKIRYIWKLMIKFLDKETQMDFFNISTERKFKAKLKFMEDKPNDIFSRHCSEKGFDIAGAFKEMEARLKTAYTVIDEMKEVITGQAKWAEIVDIRLSKLEPKIQIFSEEEAKTIIRK